LGAIGDERLFSVKLKRPSTFVLKTFRLDKNTQSLPEITDFNAIGYE
jgi:hypothetical protein